MNGHVGAILDDCETCPTPSGRGMEFAAQHIRHCATSEIDLDLAELCEWTAATHKPNADRVCVGCGEVWIDDPNVGVIPCETFSAMRIEKNLWVLRQVAALSSKWRHLS